MFSSRDPVRVSATGPKFGYLPIAPHRQREGLLQPGALARAPRTEEEERPSGDLPSPNGRQNESDPEPSLAEHVDERVDAEQIDAPADQVAHPGLGDLEQLRGLGLRETSIFESKSSDREPNLVDCLEFSRDRGPDRVDFCDRRPIVGIDFEVTILSREMRT
jgi:hypothetical protein